MDYFYGFHILYSAANWKYIFKKLPNSSYVEVPVVVISKIRLLYIPQTLERLICSPTLLAGYGTVIDKFIYLFREPVS